MILSLPVQARLTHQKLPGSKSLSMMINLLITYIPVQLIVPTQPIVTSLWYIYLNCQK